jgi:hypothetical protein
MEVVNENRIVQSRWTEKCYFICIKGAAVCIICNENVSVLKEYSVKRHYETKRASQPSDIQGQLRMDLITQLQNRLVKQQCLFSCSALQTGHSVRASTCLLKF